MVQFESFGSGSSGNLYYIKSDKGALLIDAGIGIRKMRKFFREYGIRMSDIKGVLVTHNHMDHVRCLGILNQKDNLPVYMTAKVFDGIKENPAINKKPLLDKTTIIEKEKPFELSGFEIHAFEVPHDSKDNVGYFLKKDEIAFCIVTDCGSWTNDIEKYVSKATYLVLESNYDTKMLEEGPYSKKLKLRISNSNGHLSNEVASTIIQRHQSHLKHIWLCHLSEKNNTPEKALMSAKKVLYEDKKEIVETLSRTTPSKLYLL